MQILEVKSLEKNFGGRKVLQGVDVSVGEGQIVGLLGPNAAGKTTLMKTIAGLLQPTAGEILYPDMLPRGVDSRRAVAFCPDALAFPHWMRLKDAFTFYRDMYPDYEQARADKLIEILDLAQFAKMHVHKLSKGMKERLILGLTFSRATKLYMLDEPLDGIDPLGKTKIIDAIIALKPDDASVLVSTHMVKDLERIFDSVYFLSKGKIIFNGACDAMREQNGKTVEQAYLEVFMNEGAI